MEQHRCWIEELEPALASENISVVRPEDVTAEQRTHLEHFVRRTLLPVLTPLAIDPGPFRTWRIARWSSPPRFARRRRRCFPMTRLLVVVHLPSQVVLRFVPPPSAPGEARASCGSRTW